MWVGFLYTVVSRLPSCVYTFISFGGCHVDGIVIFLILSLSRAFSAFLVICLALGVVILLFNLNTYWYEILL